MELESNPLAHEFRPAIVWLFQKGDPERDIDNGFVRNWRIDEESEILIQ